jgi:putative endonuclease
MLRWRFGMLGLLYRGAAALRRRAMAGDHGRIGEDIAHCYLRSRGCTVVARNYRPRSGMGEIDLVVWHGDTLSFVEVKTRAAADYGSPDSAVDAEKRSRLERAARDYARRAAIEWDRTRFDIVSIILSRPPQITWEKDAFGSSPPRP